MALMYTPELDHNMSMPDFRLLNVDGKIFDANKDLNTQAKATLIMFICNHCPYVKAIEDRLVQLGQDLKDRNINVIAISSNDANHYPEDSFEKMQEKAKDKNYTFPYLYDETQSVAKNFGAVCTPDFFVFDQNKKLKYRGRIDDSWKDPTKVNRRELFEATIAISENRPVPFKEIPSMGCSMKWKSES